METATERMVRDVFPAEVLIGGKIHTKARVFITTNRIQVYVKDENDNAHLLVETPCTHEIKPSRNTLSREARLHVQTPDGPISVALGRGCSCGSLQMLPGPISWSR